jgi:hypothetical protein
MALAISTGPKSVKGFQFHLAKPENTTQKQIGITKNQTAGQFTQKSNLEERNQQPLAYPPPSVILMWSEPTTHTLLATATPRTQ